MVAEEGLANASCWRMPGALERSHMINEEVEVKSHAYVCLSWHPGKKEASAKAVLSLVLRVKAAAGEYHVWRPSSFPPGAEAPEKAEKAPCPRFAPPLLLCPHAGTHGSTCFGESTRN